MRQRDYVKTELLTADEIQEVVDFLQNVAPYSLFALNRLRQEGEVTNKNKFWLWLLNNGFATKGEEIDTSIHLYPLRLTDDGRRLKKLGSLAKYYAWEERKFKVETFEYWGKKLWWFSLLVSSLSFLFAVYVKRSSDSDQNQNKEDIRLLKQQLELSKSAISSMQASIAKLSQPKTLQDTSSIHSPKTK